MEVSSKALSTALVEFLQILVAVGSNTLGFFEIAILSYSCFLDSRGMEVEILAQIDLMDTWNKPLLGQLQNRVLTLVP